jgi:hypothetical protein
MRKEAQGQCSSTCSSPSVSRACTAVPRTLETSRGADGPNHQEPHAVPSRPRLLRITKHTDATEASCGLDITYRDGWRRGAKRPGGTHQVILTQDDLDPFDDGWTELAGCPCAPRN